MMSNELSQTISMELKLRNQFPKFIDYTYFSNRHWFASYDVQENEIMSESSTAGMDYNRETAFLKVLSERVERIAYREGYAAGKSNCMTERSDGFAAYPKVSSKAQDIARTNALNEAIERFVWATWWDSDEIRFSAQTLELSTLDLECSAYLSKVIEKCGLTEISLVTPEVQGTNSRVLILLAKRRAGGYISGGACGEEFRKTLSRAVDELFRHGLAATKCSNDAESPKSFYERRLKFFLTAEGQQLVEGRISKSGNTSVILPKLFIDNQVEHTLSDLYVVHRCLFENQPQFMGGNLERFCL